MLKSKVLTISKYIMFFLMFVLFQKATINNVIFAFSFGLFFALVWCNQNILILSPLYIASAFLKSFLIVDVYFACLMCGVMTIIYLIHLKLKKQITIPLLIVYCLLSIFGKVFFDVYSGAKIIVVFSEVVFNLLFMISCSKLYESFKVRGFFQKITFSQFVCLGIVLVAIMCGFWNLEIYDFSVIKFFICCFVLFSVLVFSPSQSCFLGVLLAICSIFPQNNCYLVTPILMFLFCALALKNHNKIFMCLAVLVSEIMCLYYFDFYYTNKIIAVVPTAVACLIFCLIKNNVIEKLRELFEKSGARRSVETIINRNRNSVCKKIHNLSNVFLEMDSFFKGTINTTLAKDQLQGLMCSELYKGVCSDCPNKNRCYKTYENETKQILSNLASTAFNKGKVSILDVPSLLSTRCKNINRIVFYANDLLMQYKNYNSMVENVDNSKLLLSQQFYGVGQVLKSLAKDIGQTVVFDKGIEQKIVQELLYFDVVCSDAMVFYDNLQIVSVVLEVKKEDSQKNKIEQVVSKVCKTKMFVESDSSSVHSGYQILNFKTSPKFDIVFGTANCKKASSEKSGDCFSISRMPNNKILMAICDGMGSGDIASKTSAVAMSLLENFYKAGFQSDIALESINKFLSISSAEMFSCLDLAVVDLNSLCTDIVKLGATNSYIKKSDTTRQIECKSMPLGIIKSLKPQVESTTLENGDMLIISSDGVNDSFSCDDAMLDFVNNIISKNPQQIATEILNKAIKNNVGVAKDDMTIIVAKVFSDD